MRRLSLALWLCCAVSPVASTVAKGQTAPSEEGTEGEAEPGLRPPSLESLQMPALREDEDTEKATEADESKFAEEDAKLLAEAPPVSSDPTVIGWHSPTSVFTVHGYFRVRGELWDKFYLNRFEDPFNYFIPATNGRGPDFEGAIVSGGCRGEPTTTPGEERSRCGGGDRLRFANMRLRLQPTLAVSDDVRIHMMFDVFDNLVLGSTPETKVFDEAGNATGIANVPGRVPGANIDTQTSTVSAPVARQNATRDAIVARRVWGEVTNRAIGQLRFGRMGHQWGLGMLYNPGEELDADFQSDIDRVQGITQFKGFFFGASWDFPSSGAIFDPGANVVGVPFDLARKDDIKQWSLMVARRLDPFEQRKRLAKGDWVLNGGIYFIYRKQSLSSSTAPLFVNQSDFDDLFVRRGAKVFVPDLWAQFLWKNFRFEAEFAYIAGQITNIGATQFTADTDLPRYKLRSYGLAFESEMRFVSKKLGVYFNTGLASGDPNVNGLSDREDLITQDPADNRRLENFAFHPNYRIDEIFWRHIMGRIDGAWYFNPAVSYDIIRNPFGQLFGARASVVYSRAMEEQQAYGSEPSLGVELDLKLYYSSEDGPGFMDGYHIQFMYGLFFPLAGLDFRKINGVKPANARSVGNAQQLRLIFGIVF